MTVAEADLLSQRNLDPAHQRPLVWQPHSAGFVSLQARPCPFLGEDARCTVYDIRPYNCRRFICGRVDVASEPLEFGGPLGCWNLSDRVEQSERFLHHYETTQRKAMPWALEHGWKRS